MVAKAIDIAKELRLFIAFIMTATGTSILNFDKVMDYVYTYNIHIIFVSTVLFYLHHFFSNNRHKKSEDVQKQMQDQIKSILLENSKTQIRAEIRQAYKDYKQIENIEFETTIKYLNDLEKKRLELGINSYTDEMMTELLNKIKL